MGAFFNPLGTVHKVVGGVLLLAILGLGLAFWRADSLRATHLEALNGIVATLRNVTGTKKIATKDAPQWVQRVADDRDQYRRERDNAREVLRTQSEKISEYEAETKRLREISEKNRVLAASLIEDRQRWIERANVAADRTERLAAEAELKQCEETLDALYQADF